MATSIDDILNNLFESLLSADYGTGGNGQGYDVKIYGVPELTELLESIGLIAPESSLYTLAEVYDAVEGFHYNASSNFATLQADLLVGIEALIIENSPVIDGGDTAAFTIDENTAAVSTITATDLQGDMLTYSLSGADAFLFQIDASGALSFIDAPDYETALDDGGDNVYDVTVTVSDGAQIDSQDVAVTVADVYESTTLNIAVVYDVLGDADAVTAQLNDTTVYDFTATKVHYTDADSLEELSAYDVVIHAGDLTEAFSPGYWAALREYVQTNEGGVVTTGWMGAAMSGWAPLGVSLDDANYVTPIANAGYGWSFGNITPNTGHPITDGISLLVTPDGGQHFEVPKGLDAGAVDWSNGFRAIVTKEVAGEGNTVYLGGHYTESTYVEGNLRTGEWDQLLEQAVDWAAGDDVFGF